MRKYGYAAAGGAITKAVSRMERGAAVFRLWIGVLAVFIGFALWGQTGTGEVGAKGNDVRFQGWVQDDADLLTEEEEESLERECARVSELYRAGVYIVTTPDFGGGDIKDWQRQIFREYGLGADCSDSGIMLAVSMAERDWGLVGFGTAQEAFTTYGRERMGEKFLDDLSDGDYYDAFEKYVSMSEDFLAAAEEGKPYTEDHPYGEGWRIPVIIGISFLLSLSVSLAVVLSWKKSMNTRVRRDGAMEYMKEGSFHLYDRTDRFLYHTVTRSKRETENHSGSGGGMSSDHSGTSGKF